MATVVIPAPLDLDDRDAVGVQRLVGLLLIPVGDAVGEQQAFVGVLVVLCDEAVPRPVDWKIHQAVVVHAPLPRLVSRAVARVVRELRPARHRIAPGDEDFGRVSAWHRNGVGGRYLDAAKAEQRPRP